MKKISSSVLAVFILFIACKKENPHESPCSPLGKQQEWQKYEGNPVFVKGNNSWDDGIILGHSVIKTGSTFRMWYSGGHSIQSIGSIGYATSQDGVHWTRYSNNPVFTAIPGSWEQTSVAIPSVLQDGNKLHMWYIAGGNPDDGKVGYATSSDGIHWNRHPSPVFTSREGGWYADGIFPGTVIKENGIFKMWFSGATGSVSQSTPTSKGGIGYATSPDGIAWKVYDNPATNTPPYHFSDPVLNYGTTGSWESATVLAPSVVKTKCGYEMWYAGEVFGGSQNLGYATSTDGIHWTKDPGNPVITTDPWNILLVFPSVILDGNKYRMWYGSFLLDGDAVGGAIGYATMQK
jgi:predicted GH43/DUF377 family glycosyl hydrolase